RPAAESALEDADVREPALAEEPSHERARLLLGTRAVGHDQLLRVQDHVDAAPGDLVGVEADRPRQLERARLVVGPAPHVEQDGAPPGFQEVDDLARVDAEAVAPPPPGAEPAPGAEAQERD